ncbi:MAG: biotin/lipoyl-binding protein [Halioglobus sp.]|nr:biotin/lipoyl-binding protein [Halioglobus sp.]
MLELLICSLVTVLPDYLFRRYRQGKRWGKEINFFSVWYELRWGVSACILLTVALITLIFYYHPSTSNAGPYFRTVTILSEGGGRVEEIYVENNQQVEAGAPLFSLLDSSQLAAVNSAGSQVAQVESAFVQTESQLEAARGGLRQAQGALDQAQNELKKKRDLASRGAQLVSKIELERLENTVDSRSGGVDSAKANIASVVAQRESVLPSQLESAKRALEQAEVELGKTIVYAGVDGTVSQFFLQRGDYVNPILRPAGILIPNEGPESGRYQIAAGFSQLATQVIHVGTLAEVACLSRPFEVIPMVVIRVQPVVAAGQLRPSDNLLDAQQRARPGTLTVVMEPLYEGGMEGVMPGSKCIANAYTNNHDLLASDEVSGFEALFYHAVDTVGIVHAIILRIQAMVMPVQMLVFGGH